MAINVHKLRVSNMTVGPLSGGGGGGGGASLVTSGLLGHWDMGDVNSYPGSGTTVTDLTGNGYDATMSGGSGGTVNGSGVSTYLSHTYLQTSMVANHFTFGGSSFTFTKSFWFRDLNTTDPLDPWTMFASGHLKHTGYPTQDKFSVSALFSSTEEISSFYTTYGNNWVNVATVGDSGNFSTYINGVEVSTFINTNNVPTSSTSLVLLYGSHSIYGPNLHWAQTALYNRALTASEVLQNFNALKSRYGY